MAKKLTPAEQAALNQARFIYDHKTESVPSVGFDAGFVAGLAYNQAIIDDLQDTLDRERAERLAYQEMIAGRLQGLSDKLKELL